MRAGLWVGLAASFIAVAAGDARGAQDTMLRCETLQNGSRVCYEVPAPVQVLEAVTIKAIHLGPIDEWEYRLLFENRPGTPILRPFGGGFRTGDPTDSGEVGKDDPCDSAPAEFGNPIEPATGAKREVEIDFATKGEMPLYLQRTYSSVGGVGTMFGNRWRTNFEMWLQVEPDAITAHRDGARIQFTYQASTNDWRDKSGSVARVVVTSGGYTLYAPDNLVETYDTSGRVLAQKNRRGVGLTFHYATPSHLSPAATVLDRVVHTSGRTVQFHWNRFSSELRVTQVIDPAGVGYVYEYDTQRRLVGVQLPGSPATKVTYHFGNMHGDSALRGKSIDGVRYSTFDYDYKSRAISTEHAGGVDRHTFVYTEEPDGVHTVLHTNPLGKKATYRYQDHRMVSSTGQASAHCSASYREFTYDAKGREHIVADFEGNLTEFAYDAYGRRTIRKEAAGTSLARTTTWAWNTQNQLASITLSGQTRRDFTYRTDGLLSKETTTNLSANGVNGQVRSTTYAYTFHPNTLVATIVIDGPLSGTGDAITQTFDSVGNLLSVRNSLGHQTTYAQHNVFGQAGRETNANGGVIERSFDARGRLLVESRVVGTARHSTRWTYNASGKLASITSPDGTTARYVYDAAQRLIEVQRPLSSPAASMALEPEVDPMACHQCEEDPDYNPTPPNPPPPAPNNAAFVSHQVATTMTAGRAYTALVTMRNSGTVAWLPGQHYTLTAHNAALMTWNLYGVEVPTSVAPGDTVTFTLPIEAPSTPGTYTFQWRMAKGMESFGWSSSALSIVVKAPPPAPTDFVRFTYNANSQVTVEQAGRIEAGVTTITRSAFTDYDELGRVRKLRGNNGQSVTTTYDDVDNPITTTDALGRKTTRKFDAFGRMIETVDPMGAKTKIAYDAADRIVSVTDARQVATTYKYDGFGQLLQQVSRDSGTTTFTYTAQGLRSSMTRNDGSALAYEYDALGRMVSAVNDVASRNYTWEGCTGGKGRLCAHEVVSSGVVNNSGTHVYDAFGAMTSKRDNVFGASDLTSFPRDGEGRATGITYPSGTKLRYAYTDGTISGLYVDLGSGEIPVVTDVDYRPFDGAYRWIHGNGIVRRHSYDDDGRLTGITAQNSSQYRQALSYEYNAADQVTQLTNTINPSMSQTYTYDNADRLTGSNAVGYAYDATGNRLRRTEPGKTTDYVVASDSNRLLSTAGASTAAFTLNANGDVTGWTRDGTAHSVVYDAFNRMIRHSANNMQTQYRFNALDQRVGISNSAGGSRRTIHDGHRLLAETVAGVGWVDYLWLGNTLVGIVRGGQLHAVHTDHLGRPEVATNSARSVVWRANNGAFGREAVTIDTLGGLHIGFPGQYHDVESGLEHNGARDYDRFGGRYLQTDPIGLAGGLNTYLYAGANPITRVDPLGLDDVSAILYGAGVIDRMPDRSLNGTGYMGAGGFGQFGPMYMSIDSGIAIDSGMTFCFQAHFCQGIGVGGIYGGLGGSIGVSSGQLCSGESSSTGIYRAGGQGFMGQFQATAGQGNVSISKGVAGVGGGVPAPGGNSGAGGLTCQTVTICPGK